MDIKEEVLNKVKQLAAAEKKPVVAFDIDNTVLFNSAALLDITEKLVRNLPPSASTEKAIAAINAVKNKYGKEYRDTNLLEIKEFLPSSIPGMPKDIAAGLENKETGAFWPALTIDRTVIVKASRAQPGAVAYLNNVLSAGGRIIYITSHKEGQREDVINALKHTGLPVPNPDVQLFMHPGAYPSDDPKLKGYAKDALQKVWAIEQAELQIGPVVAFFDDDADNLVAAKNFSKDIITILVDTKNQNTSTQFPTIKDFNLGESPEPKETSLGVKKEAFDVNVFDLNHMKQGNKMDKELKKEASVDISDLFVTKPMEANYKTFETSTPEFLKIAAHEPGESVEETINYEWNHLINGLTDFVLAEQLTELELRGMGKPVGENYAAYFQETLKDVKKNRKNAEKKLFKLIPRHSQLDACEFFDRVEEQCAKEAEAKERALEAYPPAGVAKLEHRDVARKGLKKEASAEDATFEELEKEAAQLTPAQQKKFDKVFKEVYDHAVKTLKETHEKAREMGAAAGYAAAREGVKKEAAEAIQPAKFSADDSVTILSQNHSGIIAGNSFDPNLNTWVYTVQGNGLPTDGLRVAEADLVLVQPRTAELKKEAVGPGEKIDPEEVADIEEGLGKALGQTPVPTTNTDEMAAAVAELAAQAASTGISDVIAFKKYLEDNKQIEALAWVVGHSEEAQKMLHDVAGLEKEANAAPTAWTADSAKSPTTNYEAAACTCGGACKAADKCVKDVPARMGYVVNNKVYCLPCHDASCTSSPKLTTPSRNMGPIEGLRKEAEGSWKAGQHLRAKAHDADAHVAHVDEENKIYVVKIDGTMYPSYYTFKEAHDIFDAVKLEDSKDGAWAKEHGVSKSAEQSKIAETGQR